MKQNKDKDKRSPLEKGLIMALQAVDKQIAREMQRNPEELERHGVQKWEPYSKRIEAVCGQLVSMLGAGECQLDSLLVMSQAFSKALYLVVEDLAEEDLGDVRSRYCRAAMEALQRDSNLALQALKEAAGPDLV